MLPVARSAAPPNMEALQRPHNHCGSSLRRSPPRSTTLRPDQNHAATAAPSLELLRSAKQIRVDLDAEDLTGADGHRLRLEGGQRVVDSVDEVHRRTIAAELAVVDLPLAALQLDEHPGSVRAQLD